MMGSLVLDVVQISNCSAPYWLGVERAEGRPIVGASLSSRWLR
jgi:hypothetical protein